MAVRARCCLALGALAVVHVLGQEGGAGDPVAPTPPPPPPPAPPALADAHVIKKLREAQSGALPKLLHALERAKQAGVPESTVVSSFSASHVKAAADLALFAEVASLAGSSKMNVAHDMQEVLSTSDINPGRINSAFQFAKLAGVPDEEVATARQTLQSELGERLDRSIDNTKTSPTVANMQHMATLVQVWHQLALPAERIEPAQGLYLAQFNGTLDGSNMTYIEEMVDLSDRMRVKAPEPFQKWAKASKTVREAAQLPVDMEHHYVFVDAMRASNDAGLPHTADVLAVEAAVETCTQRHLDRTLTRKGGESHGEFVNRLYHESQDAKAVHLSKALADELRLRALQEATAYLQPYEAFNIDQVGEVKRALNLAEKCGVDEATRSAARDFAHARGQAWLSAAMSAVEANSSIANVETLAWTLKAGEELQLDPAQLEAGRNVFRTVAESVNGETDMDLVEALVRTRDEAHVALPPKLVQWATMARKIREGLEEPGADVKTLEMLRNMLRSAKDIGHPETPELIALRTKAQSTAETVLSNTVLVEKDRHAFLEILDMARETGLTGAVIDGKELEARTMGREALSEAQGFGVGRESDVNYHISLARQLGVPSPEIETAKVSIRAGLEANLATATAAFQANVSEASITDLGKALRSCKELSLAEEPCEDARTLLRSRIEGLDPNLPESIPLYEAVFDILDGARMNIDIAKKRTIMAKDIRKVMEGSTDKMVDVLQVAQKEGFPDTDEHLALKAKAKQQATDELEDSVSTETAVIDAAIAAAVSAGVPASSLDSGNAISSATSARRLQQQR